MTITAPRFTVVVPTFNRPGQLSVCLEAMAALDYPREAFEVVVVDDGGTAALEPVIAGVADRLDVRLVRQANAGPGPARNAGIHAARGRFVAFTDDDCQPHPAWLRAYEAVLRQFPDALVGGHTINRLTENPYSSMSQQIQDIVYRHYNADPAHATFFASSNIAAARDRLLAVNGFEANVRLIASEDRNLCDVWRFQGGPMRYVPAAIVYHAHPLTLGKYMRQHFQYGQGAYSYHRLRAERGSGSITTEMSFHRNLDNWLFRPVREAKGLTGKAATLGLVGLWQGINIAGYFYAWARQLLRAGGRG